MKTTEAEEKGKGKKRSKRKIAFWLFVIVGAVILTVTLVASTAIGLTVTPTVLTPHVVEIAQKYINSEISIKSVDISLLHRFPNVTLRIDSLRITQTKDSIGDLLFARECRVSVNPLALLNKKLVVNHLSLRGASMYIYVDSLHGPLKHFNFDSEELADDLELPDTLESFDMSDYSALLKRIRVDSMQITVDDRTRRFYTRVDNFGVDMSMHLSSHKSRLDLVTGFSNLIVWHDGDLLVKKTSMELDTKLFLNQDSMKMSFERADLRLNGIDFKSSGKVRQDSISGGVMVDINSTLNSPSLSEFLELIPSSIIDGKDKISTQGKVDLTLDVKGVYAENQLPTVAATIKVDNAKAKYASRKLSLESVSCDAYTFVDFNTPQNTYTDIKSLHINTSGIIDLYASGRVDNFLENPAVDMAVKSTIDFDRFTEVFPLNEAIVCSGTNSSNIKAKFKMNDMLNSNYANLVIDGESKFTNLEIAFDASKFAQDSTNTAFLNIKANEGSMLFGDKVRPDTDSRTLLSTINFTNLNYKAKSGEYLTIADLEMSAGANFDRNTSEVNGVGIRGVAKNSSVGIDTLFNAALESSDVTFTISPKNSQHDTKIKAIISSQKISADEPTYNSSLKLSKVEMNLDLQKEEQQERWDMKGNVGFSNLGMFTDLFPLNIKVTDTNVSVDNSTIYLTNARLRIGESEITATGHINYLISKLFLDPRSKVSGKLAVSAPTLNITELIEATNSSVLMSEEEQEEETTESSEEVIVAEEIMESSATETEETTKPQRAARVVYIAQEEPIASADSTIQQQPSERSDSLSRREGGDGRGGQGQPQSALFLVPRGVDFVFDLNIDKALFEEATIENVAGRATIQRGALILEKLTLNTIGGEASGTMIYRNTNRRSANLAFNMVLSGVDINRIGELNPSMSSMFPMLDSFEGIVDFGIKANANLNANGELDITSLQSAMEFKGKNLVLMDSETFAELSKTLMFKNKDRNLIESLDVYALVKESTVDVLPFLMTIDRYQAIIGGTQTIDPTTFNVEYDYNVSIMKSPLPFKAGVDITGDLEDFDFKVTKAKLKETDFDEQVKIYEAYRNSIAE